MWLTLISRKKQKTYQKIPKNLDTGKIAVIHLKVEQGAFTLE